VRLVRERRPAGGGGARSAVQRKALQGRTPGVNRFSPNSSHERQADEAADGTLRKQRNVARILTPAPPARYAAPSSTGAMLPEAVRGELEEAFGADLSEMRVHHDGGAHAAARLEEARAFTAGRDVYFGQGAFDPASAEGKRLLAHEVAHVLQQTGRRTSTTMIHATTQEGAGEPQKEIEVEGSARAPRFTEARRRYAATLARLRAGSPPEGVEPRGEESS
jgi:uncharacterized protein DUF4157